MTTVINLLGAPGAGKTIAAMDLCSMLRKDYVHAELISEAAKDHIYDGTESSEIDQLAIFAEQYKRVKRLNGKVKFIISDSPLFLSGFYAQKYGYHSGFSKYSIQVANEFKNLNFLIHRHHRYDPNGRSQTEEESNAIHVELKDYMYLHNVDYIPVIASADARGVTGCDIVYATLKREGLLT